MKNSCYTAYCFFGGALYPMLPYSACICFLCADAHLLVSSARDRPMQYACLVNAPEFFSTDKHQQYMYMIDMSFK